MRKFPILVISLLATASTAGYAQTNAEEEEAVPQFTRKARQIESQDALLSSSVYGEAGIKYIDNIYRSPNNEESDFVGFVRPGAMLRSQTDEYKARARAEVERGVYFSESENNYTDADFRADGRYALSQTTGISGEARYRFDHVAIGAFLDDPTRQAEEPTNYRYGEAGLALDHTMDAWRFDVGTTYGNYNYDNVNARGGARIINDDRDRYEVESFARVGNYIRPDVMLYGKGIYNFREYDENIDSTAVFGLDSDGYELLVGSLLGGEGMPYRADVNVGYLEQNYDSSFRHDIDGWAANADAFWDVTPEISLRGILNRSVEESTLTGASGYLRTRVGLGAEYNFLPQWTAAALVRYTNYDFEINPASGAADREDDVVDTSLALIYDITDVYHVGGEYVFVERESDDPTVEYDSNTFILRLSASY